MTNHYLCFIIVRIERRREVIKVENTVEYESFPFFFLILLLRIHVVIYQPWEDFIEVKIDLRYFFSSLPTAHALVNKLYRETPFLF